MNKDGKFFSFGKNVTIAGFVSFFINVSSEMIYPLVPLFLANTLGVNRSLTGLGLTGGNSEGVPCRHHPAGLQATAFGVYTTAAGLAMFPASLIGGWLWGRYHPQRRSMLELSRQARWLCCLQFS